VVTALCVALMALMAAFIFDNNIVCDFEAGSKAGLSSARRKSRSHPVTLCWRRRDVEMWRCRDVDEAALLRREQCSVSGLEEPFGCSIS
jgi:hypothetical protein